MRAEMRLYIEVTLVLLVNMNLANGQCVGRGNLQLTEQSGLSADGRSSHLRLEICSGKKWLTICADETWNNKAARVACRQQNLSYTGAMVSNLPRVPSVQDLSSLRIHKLSCTGREPFLVKGNRSCKYGNITEENCEEIVGLQCKPAPTMAPTESDRSTAMVPTSKSTEQLENDSTGPELWFTEIIFNQRGQVKLSWEVQPHVMTEGATYSLECNSSKGVKKEKTDLMEMSSTVLLETGQRYECCISADSQNQHGIEECITITTPPPVSLPTPERQTDLMIGGVASLGVTIALFVVMVIVWVIISVVMCRRRSKGASFSPSSYEVQYSNAHHQLQSPALPARNTTSYNTLGPMYELIPDPTYEHINRGPAEKINQRNRNSTVKEQEVTKKSHDIQYHVLKQSTNAKEGTSHDLQGNPSIVKDDTKDHTYHVLENSLKVEGHQKLDNESTNEQATTMEDSHTSGGQNRTDFPKTKEVSNEQTYHQKHLTAGEPQEYEVPICSIDTK